MQDVYKRQVKELLGTEENGIIMENSFAGIYYGMKEALDLSLIHI